MAFRLKLDESIESAVRRIGIDQIDRIRRQLAAGADPAAEIHDARKGIKRLRALLRLARDGLGENVFRAENARYREIAAALAPARDAHVIRQTIAALRVGARGTAAKALARLAGRVQRDADAATGGPAPDIAKVLAAIDRAERRMRTLEVQPDSFATLARGLVRTHRQGLARFEAAYAEDTDHAVHQWRKSVQAHWRHMVLVSRAFPALFDAEIAAARELSRLLGDDHDLAVLSAYVAGLPQEALSASDRQLIERMIAGRQDELRILAKPLGRMIYAERPKAHGRRIVGLWKGAVARHRLQGAAEEEARADLADRRAVAPPVTQ